MMPLWNDPKQPLRRAASLFAVGTFLIGLYSSASAAEKPMAEVVVAIRYLQPEGVSHAHLYLYREDGRLLRQLTRMDAGQDRAPIFAPDGETIVFQHSSSADVVEYWTIQPRGGDLRRLESAPEWYSAARTSPFFTSSPPADWREGEPMPGSPVSDGDVAPRFIGPDGSVELVLSRVEGEEDNGTEGAHYLLRDVATGKETKMADLPGFERLRGLLHASDDPKRFFLFDGDLRVAFFALHLNSTDGDTTYALDISGRRIIHLSPNWATPVPLPGEPAFLTFTEERYLPIPQTTKTANCSFIDRWDAKLNRVRYAKSDSAPICYGASIYRPGKTPAVVTIKDSQR